MRMALAIFATLVLVSCAHAGPAALHLRWNACFGEAGATGDRAFGCDVDTGSEALVLSFAPDHDVSRLIGYEAAVDIGASGTALPSWWELSSAPGSCRQGFGAIEAAPDPAWTCLAHWTGASAAGFFTIAPTPYAASRFRIAVVQSDSVYAIGPGDGEVFLATMGVARVRTTGGAACAGCTTPLCLAFTELVLYHPGAEGTEPAEWPAATSDAFVTWQGAGAGPQGCGIVPARNRTWGAIKSMYR